MSAVYISGGGSGIGRELAKRFGREGHALAIFDLRVSDEVRQELQAIVGPQNLYVAEVDIRQASQLADAASEAARQWRPQLAVNCAGIQLGGAIDAQTAEQFQRVIDINLVGSRNFAAAVLPHMDAESQLVFVASLAGLVGNFHYSAYNASKFGVVGLAHALRLECLPRGIRVSVVCPPEVDSPMVEEELKTMHPTTRELKLVAGTLALEPAVKEIMRGIKRGDFEIIPGSRARMVARLSRWIPGILRRRTNAIVLKTAP